VVPAFIHRNFIQPGAECRPKIKPLNRKESLRKSLLRYVLHIFTAAQYPAHNSEYPVLMCFDEFLVRADIALLGTPHNLRFFTRRRKRHSRLGQLPRAVCA
jgi:hypothetical protein